MKYLIMLVTIFIVGCGSSSDNSTTVEDVEKEEVKQEEPKVKNFDPPKWSIKKKSETEYELIPEDNWATIFMILKEDGTALYKKFNMDEDKDFVTDADRVLIAVYYYSDSDYNDVIKRTYYLNLKELQE